jgi:hypothetical protein
MKIWDMIKVAFDFDMYKAWLNWACNGEIATNYPVQNKYFVGYRMLRARKSGTLENYEIEIEHLKQYIVELQINKVKGAKVTNTLRDNSDGIGHVIVKHEDISQLYLLLDEIEDYVASKLSIS